MKSARTLSSVCSLVLTLLLTQVPEARSTVLPAGFSERQIATLDQISVVTFAPDGRIFVGTKTGDVRIVKDGELLPVPFVTVDTDTAQERGLNGLVLDPDFEINGYVYVYYTAKTPTVHNRLSRFTANGDVSDGNGETILFEVDDLLNDGEAPLYASHNGGALHFGADGKLYVAVGDNARGPLAQQLDTLFGKMLRLNPDGSIPEDNPFYGTTTGAARAIWAYGLRNPYTFAIDRVTGQMLINDVGNLLAEEINDAAPADNFGWPITEGYTDDPRFRSPLYAYGRGDGEDQGCAVTGGDFYELDRSEFPEEYRGKYFFLDFCNQWIRVLDPVTGETEPFARDIKQWPVALAVGNDGSIYYAQHYGTALGLAGLFAISYDPEGAPTISREPEDQVVAVGDPVTFRVEASGPAPLQYEWRRNGYKIPGAEGATLVIPSATLDDHEALYHCVITNATGSVASRAAMLRVIDGAAPAVSIDAPVATIFYAGGDSIAFSGSAIDPEDGPLPPAAFEWIVDFHHDDHHHPFMDATAGITSGEFVIPTSGETSSNVWYRIHLTVTDSSGLSRSIFRDIHPRVVELNFESSPVPGLEFTLDGQPFSTPYKTTSVTGIRRHLSIAPLQMEAGHEWQFAGWSDGGAREREYVTPDVDAALTAIHLQTGSPAAGSFAVASEPLIRCGSMASPFLLEWNVTGAEIVEVRVDAPDGPLFAQTRGSSSKIVPSWAQDGTTFYLQNADSTDGQTLATYTVRFSDTHCDGRSAVITAVPNPVAACGLTYATVEFDVESAGVELLEIRLDAPDGLLFARITESSRRLVTGNWVTNGRTFYVQDVSNGRSLTPYNTLATTTVQHVCDSSFQATPNPIAVCDSLTGTATLSWSFPGVSLIEIRVGAPDGPLFARTGSSGSSIASWITDGMIFYAQNVSDGRALTAANTLDTLVVTHSCDASFFRTQPDPVPNCDDAPYVKTQIEWSFPNASGVRIHVHSPDGPLFAQGGPTGSAETGVWVTNGTLFYAQDADDPEVTLGVVAVTVTDDC